jgi:hypothetical protein
MMGEGVRMRRRTHEDPGLRISAAAGRARGDQLTGSRLRSIITPITTLATQCS